MSDEYELVSRKELEYLRSELRKKPEPLAQQPSVPETAQLDRFSHANENAKIIYLNNNIEKMNHSLRRLLMLFDQAQKELIEQKPDNLDSMNKIISQNEKITQGLVSVTNTMRDQQIQLNQLNMLYQRTNTMLDQMRMQRRPHASFKALPVQEQRPEVQPRFDQPRRPLPKEDIPLDIETGPKIGDQILEEEKTETYPTFHALQKQESALEPGQFPERPKLPENPIADDTVDLDNIPEPPTHKRSFLDKIIRK